MATVDDDLLSTSQEEETEVAEIPIPDGLVNREITRDETVIRELLTSSQQQINKYLSASSVKRHAKEKLKEFLENLAKLEKEVINSIAKVEDESSKAYHQDTWDMEEQMLNDFHAKSSDIYQKHEDQVTDFSPEMQAKNNLIKSNLKALEAKFKKLSV